MMRSCEQRSRLASSHGISRRCDLRPCLLYGFEQGRMDFVLIINKKLHLIDDAVLRTVLSTSLD